LPLGTKADRLPGNEGTKAVVRLKEGLGLSDLLLCSTKTGIGLKELWAQILTRAKKTPPTEPFPRSASKETRRVPQVRASVPGLKKAGEAVPLFSIVSAVEAAE
jgi:hypothetical protein